MIKMLYDFGQQPNFVPSRKIIVILRILKNPSAPARN